MRLARWIALAAVPVAVGVLGELHPVKGPRSATAIAELRAYHLATLLRFCLERDLTSVVAIDGLQECGIKFSEEDMVDPWGNRYTVERSEAGTWEVRSSGEDGVLGTEDDAVAELGPAAPSGAGDHR
jgi:hypothetical protein